MGHFFIFVATICTLVFSSYHGGGAINADTQDIPTACIEGAPQVDHSLECVVHWPDDPNMGQPVIVYGHSNHTCSLVITNSAYNGEIVVQIRGKATGADYLYVERTQLTDYYGKYMALMNANLDQCCVAFTDKSIALEFRGNMTLTALLLQPKGAGALCPLPQPKGIECTADDPTTCSGIAHYSDVIPCLNATRCDLGCQGSSKCTLAENQVLYQYPNNNPEPCSAFITYPIDISILNLRHNNLSSVTSAAFLSVGWKLRELDFGYNQLMIAETTFRNLSDLRALYLNNNGLTYLTVGIFEGLEKLQVLDLGENDFHAVTEGVFQGLHSLSELFLLFNWLTDITGVKALVTLQSLHLDENDLEILNPDTFRGLHRLTQLFVTDNNLTAIHGQPFDGFQCLKRLSLQRNRLTVLHWDVFRGLHNLTVLDLMGNELVEIHSDAFRSLSSLIILHLEHNYLQVLNSGVFRHLDSLQVLEMNHNLLTSVSDGVFQSLKSLRALILSKNRLETVRAGWFQGLQHLLQIELWGNRLTSLETGAFQNLTNLEGLALQGNMLETLETATFKGLRNLRKLNLHNNSLRVLQHGVLDDMVQLTSLSLAKNRLPMLPTDLFQNTVAMEFLDLSENQLIDLPLIGHMDHMERLILRRNTLVQVQRNAFCDLPVTVNVIVSQPEICVCLLNDSNEKCEAVEQQSPYLTCQKMLPDTVLVIFMWIGGFGAIFGNLIVLFWRKTQPQEEYQVQKILIGNLALADLLMGMYMMIIASADAHYGDYFPMYAQIWMSGPICILAGALAITSSEASILLLTVISIDRLIHMKYQMNKYKLRVTSAKFAALAVWLFALLISSLASSQANNRNTNVYQASHVCVGLPLAQKPLHQVNTTRFNKTEYIMPSVEEYDYWQFETEDISTLEDREPGMYLSIAVFLVLNPLCCIIIAGCYIDIVVTVFRSVGHMRRQRHIRHETRMTVKVFAIVATDLCCWCPIILTSILVQADVVQIAPRTFVWIVTFILPINSVINPYLYTLGNVIADRLPKANGTSSSRATCTTTVIDRQSRPDPTSHVNQPSPDEECDNARLILKKQLVVMETTL